MANQLGKFTPSLAGLTQPLRDLLHKSKSWMWGPPQSTAFERIKEELSKPTTLVQPLHIRTLSSLKDFGRCISTKVSEIDNELA